MALLALCRVDAADGILDVPVRIFSSLVSRPAIRDFFAPISDARSFNPRLLAGPADQAVDEAEDPETGVDKPSSSPDWKPAPVVAASFTSPDTMDERRAFRTA